MLVLGTTENCSLGDADNVLLVGLLLAVVEDKLLVSELLGDCLLVLKALLAAL